MRLYVTLVIGFFAGSVVDALIFPHIGQYGLLLPAAMTGLVGVAYTIYRHRVPQPEPG